MTPFAVLLAAHLSMATQAPLQPPPSATETQAEAYFQFLQGRALDEAGDLAGAAAAYRRALELQPDSPSLHAELAMIDARSGQATDALTESLAALKIDPDNRMAHRIMGFVQASMAETATDAARQTNLETEAIGHFEKALAAGPNDLGVDLALAHLYVDANQAQKAVPLLQTFLDERPDYAEAALLLADAYEGTHQIGAAVSVMESFVKEQPTDARAASRLAGLYEQAERWTDAASAWDRLSTQNPTVAGYGTRASLARANARLAAKDLSGAAAILENAVERTPGESVLGLTLASVYEQAKNLDKAEGAFRSVIAHDASNAEALNDLGYMLADNGLKLDEAVGLIQRALVIDPGNPSFLDSLGWAYVKQGHADTGRPSLEQAASAVPKASVILDHLAEAYFQLKRYNDAALTWDRALSGDMDGVDKSDLTKKRDKARQLAGK